MKYILFNAGVLQSEEFKTLQEAKAYVEKRVENGWKDMAYVDWIETSTKNFSGSYGSVNMRDGLIINNFFIVEVNN